VTARGQKISNIPCCGGNENRTGAIVYRVALGDAGQGLTGGPPLVASACWCVVSFGLPPNFVPFFRASLRPSLVRRMP
jgi:hypothetical protein